MAVLFIFEALITVLVTLLLFPIEAPRPTHIDQDGKLECGNCSSSFGKPGKARALLTKFRFVLHHCRTAVKGTESA
ncbi:hypothetical protein ACFVAJ_16665 [Agromyces sp. NPDC057679]|uniref:hypothetical protein n=1 Tax=Agromyces sp. NPDC057679 TaxID=3346207 RepID=UPI00367234E2